MATIVGTSGDDRIEGTPHRDVIAALAGDDGISSEGGNDVICTGSGNDFVDAGAGADVIYSQGGYGEHLHGGTGDDVIHSARSSYDWMVGGRGSDKLYGCGGGCLSAPGAGNDLVAHSGVAFMRSKAKVHVDLAQGIATGKAIGRDRLVDVEGVLGSNFNDTIDGDGHDNDLVGLWGNDRIDGRGGNDIVDGRDGSDELDQAFDGGGRNHLVDARHESGGGSGDDDTLNGGRGNDVITDEENDEPNGSDTMRGGPGDDTLWVGPGANTVAGGSGVDMVEPIGTIGHLGSVAAVVDLAAGTMTYHPREFGRSTLSGIENAAGGWANDVLRGDADPNVLIGSSGKDRLFGRGGNDTLDTGDQSYPAQPGDYADGGNGTDSCRAPTTVHCEKPYPPPADDRRAGVTAWLPLRR